MRYHLHHHQEQAPGWSTALSTNCFYTAPSCAHHQPYQVHFDVTFTSCARRQPYYVHFNVTFTSCARQFFSYFYGQKQTVEYAGDKITIVQLSLLHQHHYRRHILYYYHHQRCCSCCCYYYYVNTDLLAPETPVYNCQQGHCTERP